MTTLETDSLPYRRQHQLTPIGGVVGYRLHQAGDFGECFLESLSQLEFLVWCHRKADLGDIIEFLVDPTDDDPLDNCSLLVRGRVITLHGRRGGRNGFGCEVLSVIQGDEFLA